MTFVPTDNYYYLYEPEKGPQYYKNRDEFYSSFSNHINHNNKPVWLCVKQSENTDENENFRRTILTKLLKLCNEESEMLNNNNNHFIETPLELDVVRFGGSKNHLLNNNNNEINKNNNNHIVTGVISCQITEEEATKKETQNNNNNNNYDYNNNNNELENKEVACFLFLHEKFFLCCYAQEFIGRSEVEYQMNTLFKTENNKNKNENNNILHLPTLLVVLLCIVAECNLPDPTLLLSQVDCIDEMVLLIAPGSEDQPDLLRRIALLRRNIATTSALLYSKERLLLELTLPAAKVLLRSSVFENNHPNISQNNNNTNEEPYYLLLNAQTLEKVAALTQRVEDARDTLNQSNINFVTGVSMRMSQSSASMDFKMQILGQVATMCLPLNLIASIFGMNCKVPFQSDEYDNLGAFLSLLD
ncbi:MGT2 magnesium transporter [Angomonas deanei]|uniref:CorA-like Mg2+ transporter protein, putative n=1 Tax=Angomonas deanei TaxID=59799 RepID=A0A7G2CSB4_9TRYP|nr:MGT2 magnesium transporter [Angomonas deanei]CAD2222435.1 CorA-like Mg2+ transporter protein, putative [Angomonas deanei]|eukprot:EPY32998.1 MGT2 magnesium transporter [Angomonas deanei]